MVRDKDCDLNRYVATIKLGLLLPLQRMRNLLMDTRARQNGRQFEFNNPSDLSTSKIIRYEMVSRSSVPVRSKNVFLMRQKEIIYV